MLVIDRADFDLKALENLVLQARCDRVPTCLATFTQLFLYLATPASNLSCSSWDQPTPEVMEAMVSSSTSSSSASLLMISATASAAAFAAAFATAATAVSSFGVPVGMFVM